MSLEPYIISRLYVLIKAHKEGLPPRPIISSIDCWVGWILVEVVAEDASINFEFVWCYQDKKFKWTFRENCWSSTERSETQIIELGIWITNIPVKLCFRLIRQNYGIISKETCVPVELLIEAVSFFMIHWSYFVRIKVKYIVKVKGLPMGNVLSQVLADIATN